IPGSTMSFECRFAPGASGCSGGTPRRHLFAETDSVYISFWLKHSTNWTGSDRPFHPHFMHLLTNKNDPFSGLAWTRLTAYVEENEGKARLATQDGQNVDVLNVHSDLTGLTEDRAVSGCNGDSDGYGNGDCYHSPPGYRNGRLFDSKGVYFSDDPGLYYKSDWHHIEAHFKLNTISEGIGQRDGVLQYWYDGVPLIDIRDAVIRTGKYPGMRFNQFILAPYIGTGSPVDQTLWVDDLVVTTGPPSDSAVTFSGQATVARLTEAGVTTVVSDTGPLPPSGDGREASLSTFRGAFSTVPTPLDAEVAHASSIGQGDRSRSEASVANPDLVIGGNTIAASFVMARAAAVWQPAPASPAVSGSSEVAGLVINGLPVAVSGAPNQGVVLPNGRVVINEQNSSTGKDWAEIMVNGLRVVVDGLADVVISSARAGVAFTGSPVCQGDDFVTGGGWITGPSGAKANFGLAGGLKNNSLWGHLTYTDHGPGGPAVKGTSVTGYTIVDQTRRHIEGTAEIDGQPGFTYTVEVSNGNAGENDTFSITLSNGYTALGLLRGGHIQLHQPCQ
ncbi:MAG: choice-of-anchor P family protein, partial [Acidobacteriota bacterium]